MVYNDRNIFTIKFYDIIRKMLKICQKRYTFFDTSSITLIIHLAYNNFAYVTNYLHNYNSYLYFV